MAQTLSDGLKIFRYHRKMSTRVNLENHYDDFEVAEILREPYSGRIFPGYENIDLPCLNTVRPPYLDEIIDKREGYWKEGLLTRGKYGLNLEMIVLVCNIPISTQKSARPRKTGNGLGFRRMHFPTSQIAPAALRKATTFS